MSTAARKARKRRGEKIVRVEKIGTPVAERSIPIIRRMINGVDHLSPSRSAMRRRDRHLAAIAPKED
jgi:hypothetical protein